MNLIHFTWSAVDRGLDSWSGQTKDLVSALTWSAVDRVLDSTPGERANQIFGLT
jgi:uncharacterized protein YjiK